MLAFSSLGDNNELRKRGWYAIWCYAPRVRKRTVYHWQQSVSVADRIEHLSNQHLSRKKNTSSNAFEQAGLEWAALNGGYFDSTSRCARCRRYR